MTFNELNLNKPLLQALEDLDYLYPTPIQEKAFPIIMSGRNVVGIAQTGTGKTFAYLLPLLRMLPFSKQKDPRVLILAPTRVLVIQIYNEIQKLTKYSFIRSAAVYGDTNINTQKQAVYEGLDILVATPGRLIDLTFTGVLRLKSLQKLVIDEVDEMLSIGLRSQLLQINEMLTQKKQILMFSATTSPEVENFISESIISPIRIEIAPHGTPLEQIKQIAFNVPNFYTKINLLELLLKEDAEMSRVLVFISSKKFADRIFNQLEPIFGDQIGVIHSNKAHNTRISTLNSFRNGTIRVLIATDIVARGMDISDVTHVVNFDMTDTPNDYLHRIGRTGRADKFGVAISFVSEAEKEYQVDVENLMNKVIDTLPLPQNLIVSSTLFDEEKPVNLGDKDYLKTKRTKNDSASFHKKKEKNTKVNLGGPKRRKEKYDKMMKAKNSNKRGKTRF